MKLCETCKYFHNDRTDAEEGFKGTCTLIIHPNTVQNNYFESKLEEEDIPSSRSKRTPKQEQRYNLILGESYEHEQQFKNDSLAFVLDASSYYARLYVDKKFCCVLHENKD